MIIGSRAHTQNMSILDIPDYVELRIIHDKKEKAESPRVRHFCRDFYNCYYVY